jgi:hypothetical protein
MPRLPKAHMCIYIYTSLHQLARRSLFRHRYLCRSVACWTGIYGRTHGVAAPRRGGRYASAAPAGASSSAAAAIAAPDRSRAPAAVAVFPRFPPKPRRRLRVVSLLRLVMENERRICSNRRLPSKAARGCREISHTRD